MVVYRTPRPPLYNAEFAFDQSDFVSQPDRQLQPGNHFGTMGPKGHLRRRFAGKMGVITRFKST